MSEKKIILVGGGGHCRSCIDVIERCKEFSIAGIVEKNNNKNGGQVLGYPVTGVDDDLESLRKSYDYALITLGQTGPSDIRQRLFKKLNVLNFILPVIISPLAYVSKYARIGEGTIIMHHAVVNAGADIGKNCILNTKCLLEHDTTVGDHTHISTAAVLNGGVVIGSGSFAGSHATVIQDVKLPDNCFLRANSLVTGEDDVKILTGGRV